MSREIRVTISIAVALLVFVGGIIYVVVSGAADCPKGQEYTVVAWMPMTVNKVTTIQPVYECRAARP